MDDDAAQALAYQCELENEYQELLELEKEYQPYIGGNNG